MGWETASLMSKTETVPKQSFYNIQEGKVFLRLIKFSFFSSIGWDGSISVWLALSRNSILLSTDTLEYSGAILSQDII